jgi:catechol 2,3-dioxygenase-like lactoylglutathione lyase family enzyme
MFHRITIRTSDPDASQAFYRTVLPAVGLERAFEQFEIAQADEGRATTRLHIAWGADSRAEVDEFWRLGVDAGYRDDGEPGPRPQYAPDYYGAFLLDPDGNSAEAVHLGNEVARGEVDHLWIRVRDLAASRSFYEGLAEATGFRTSWDHDDPPRAGFRAEAASFSIVHDGAPTRYAQVAFKAPHDDLLTDPDGNTIELVRDRP